MWFFITLCSIFEIFLCENQKENAQSQQWCLILGYPIISQVSEKTGPPLGQMVTRVLDGFQIDSWPPQTQKGWFSPTLGAGKCNLFPLLHDLFAQTRGK